MSSEEKVIKPICYIYEDKAVAMPDKDRGIFRLSLLIEVTE